MVSRCVPLMRSLISIPAGFRRMSLWTFTVYTLVGSLVWNLALVGAGCLLGENWVRAGKSVDVFRNTVLIVIAVALAWFVWRRVLSMRLRRQP